MTNALLAVLSLASVAAAGDARPMRAGDTSTYRSVREFFFHEARPDPLHQKFEELFREPWPEKGFHQHEPFRPFEDVQKLNEAFELKGVAGARVEVARGERDVVLSVRLPGSAGRPMEVRANEEKVRIALPQTAEPRRYRLHREEEQLVPLPEDADHETARVKREGDLVKITFDRVSTRPEE